MQVLYFAWVRTKIGKSSDIIDVEVKTVNYLIAHLKTLDACYVDAFLNLNGMRVAINQEFASFDDSLSQNDEVAFFPPVTGG